MSKYRCPACGANHKQFQSQCRLCGQSLAPDSMAVDTPNSAQLLSTKGSIKGIVMIGIILVIAVVAIALVFGLVSGNKTLDKAKDKIIPGSDKDGWTTLTCTSAADSGSPCIVDAGYEFSVTLPGDRTKTQSSFPQVKDGKITIWTAKISSDTLITVGYGTLTPPAAPPGSAVSAATIQNYLKDLSMQWMQSQGAPPDVVVKTDPTGIGGAPAVIARSQQHPFKMADGREAYAQQALVLKGDKLFTITVVSVYKDAEQFDRVVNSMTFA